MFSKQQTLIHKALFQASKLNPFNKFSRYYFSNQVDVSKNSVYAWKSNVSFGKRTDDYAISAKSISKTPVKIEFFEGKSPIYTYVGPRHSAVVTKSGELYTYGSGNWGILGHGDEKSVIYSEPKLVEYFAKNGIKIKKVCLGDFHSIALSEDGKVFTWGFGGEKGVVFGLFRRDPGALGHGDWVHYFTPKRVNFFAEKNINIVDISSGVSHSMCLADDGTLYSFGKGYYGLLGNGSTKDQSTPKEVILLKILKEENPNDEIIKLDCADEYTACLTKGGDVYVWGKNHQGQLGIGSGIGIDMTDSQNHPTKMIKPDESIKFVDMSCGENGMLLKDENNNVYRTGWNIDNIIKKYNLSSSIVPKVLFCGNSYYGIVDSNNDIYQYGKLFKTPSTEQINDIFKVKEKQFEGRNILSISGKFKYLNAIVN